MDIDLLHVNLCMEGVHLKELFSIHWLCEFGLVENIELVVEEYRQVRGLLVCMKSRAQKLDILYKTCCIHIQGTSKFDHIPFHDTNNIFH